MTRLATLDGLSTAEVERRRQAGQVNVAISRSSRSAWAIVRANVLTRFNARAFGYAAA
jgi:cation-transporting ATPase E